MELVLDGPMTRTGVSGQWRVAGKEPSGELNRKSRVAKGRSEVANFKSKSGKRRSRMRCQADDPLIAALQDVSETKGVSRLKYKCQNAISH
jgi:hypothetical protein